MVLNVGKPSDSQGLLIEAWASGCVYPTETPMNGVDIQTDMTGSLIIMACVTIANMRRKSLLHKLILIEVGTDIPDNQT